METYIETSVEVFLGRSGGGGGMFIQIMDPRQYVRASMNNQNFNNKKN